MRLTDEQSEAILNNLASHIPALHRDDMMKVVGILAANAVVNCVEGEGSKDEQIDLASTIVRGLASNMMNVITYAIRAGVNEKETSTVQSDDSATPNANDAEQGNTRQDARDIGTDVSETDDSVPTVRGC